MSWLHRWFRPSRTIAASQTARPRYRPGFDVLEDRTLLAGNFVPLPNAAITTVVPQVGPIPGSTATADFNGDGIPDLAIADGTGLAPNGTSGNGTIRILYGVGNGTFNQGPLLNTGGVGEVLLATGRFGPGKGVSLAALNTNLGALELFLTDGSGNLQATPNAIFAVTAGGPFGAGGVATVIASADFNRDGNPDIVIGGSTGGFGTAGQVLLYLGNGTGGLNPQTIVATNTSTPDRFAVGSFNADLSPDLALLDNTGQAAVLLNNNAAGLANTFSPGTAFANLGANANDIAAGRLNADNFSDLAITSTGPGVNTVSVFLAALNGTGSFTAAPTATVTTGVGIGPSAVGVADFNGDGLGDLVVLNTGGLTLSVSVLLNNGGGVSYTPTGGSPYALTGATAAAGIDVSSYTGIGRNDIAIPIVSGTTGSVALLQNQLVNTFYAAASGPGTPTPLVYIFNQNGQLLGQFNPLPGQNFTGGYRVAVGDVNGDGVPDLAVTTGPGGQTVIFLYDGKSILANPSNPTAIASAFAFGGGFAGGAFVAIGNLNGGSTGQIVVSADSGGGPQVNIYSFAGNTLTLARVFYAFPFAGAGSSFTFTGGVRIAIADVNRDGLGDIIAGAGPGGGPQVNIYFGSPNNFLSATGLLPTADRQIVQAITSPSGTFTGGIFVDAADFNGDRFADVIVGADSGGGPQVGIFNGAVLAANGANPQIQGFNGIQPTSFTGGMRVGSTLGLDATGVLRRVLITAAGPTGSQLTGFNIFSVFQTPGTTPQQTFTAVQFPPSSPNGNGAYISV